MMFVFANLIATWRQVVPGTDKDAVEKLSIRQCRIGFIPRTAARLHDVEGGSEGVLEKVGWESRLQPVGCRGQCQGEKANAHEMV